MTVEDRVLELYAQANPVAHDGDLPMPAAGSVLTLSEQRSSTMSDTKIRELQPGTRRPNRFSRGLVIAASAAAVILAVGVTLGLVLTRGDEPAPAEPVPTTVVTTVDAAADAARVAVAESAIAANNAGDLEAYLGHFSDNAMLWGMLSMRAEPDVVRDHQGFFLAMGAHVDMVCNSTTGNEVRCEGTYTDPINEALGHARGTGNWIFIVEDGEISRLSGTGEGGLVSSWEEVAYWLQRERPEIWAERFQPCDPPTDACLGFGDARFRINPETAAGLLDFVDEFIAASDKYPLAG